MNKYAHKSALKTLSLGILLLSSVTVATAGLYRWIDASGEVHFSDKVPPAMAQKGHSELGQDGIEKKKVLSSDALKQIESEKEAKAEEKQLLALNIEKQKLAKKDKRKHDMYLLSTFDTRDELTKYYETKISTLIGTANILSARNKSLSLKTKKLLRRQSSAKSDSLIDALKIEIEKVKKSVLQYSKALDVNEGDVINLKRQYKNDLKRYAELTQ